MASDWIRGDSKRRIVILDTSAILMLFEFSIDLKKELDRLLGAYQILILQAVVDELHVLSENARGKKKRNAKASLDLITKYEKSDVGIGSTVDDVIISAAERFSAIVVTNDTALRMRLKKKKICVIFLRGKSHLAVD